VKKIRVASVQLEHAPGDKAANLAKVRAFVDLTAAEKADIVVFPECCISGYWHLRKLPREGLAELAEPVPEGPSTKELVALAKKTGMTVGAGLVEVADDGQLFNTYAVAVPDGRVVRHRKLHCFISEHMASGSEYTVFDDPHGCRVGVLICYDNNIVENVRITALAGAELLLAPHQTGGCQLHNPHAMGAVDRKLWDAREEDPAAIEAELRGDKGRGWLMRWLPSRAHDNGIFLAFSNGVGVDDDEVRTGNATVLDPYGRVLAETWKAADEVVVADLDPALLEKATGRRWITTRRPELYGPLTAGQGKDTREVRFDI
jgi:predicted amidohydrolase